MQPLRPLAKMGIVAGGIMAAFAAAVGAVYLRQRLTDGPDAQASAGMQAGGEMILGLGVFGLLTLAPLALALYWLRPVARFWTLLAGVAVLFVPTGLAALIVSGWPPQADSYWAILALARIGLMPLAALALLACGIFAPGSKQRWILLGAALVEGGVLATVVLVKFVLTSH